MTPDDDGLNLIRGCGVALLLEIAVATLGLLAWGALHLLWG